MDYSSMYLSIELPENVIDRVNVGQRVLVTNYNIKSDTLSGQVTQLSPAINETTRTFSGFITIDNSALKLRPGMFVKGDIITLQKDQVLAVPKEIVKSQRGNRSVFIIERNMAVERGIKIGISDDTHVEVESGLNEDDKVVIKGYEWLRNRSQVKIMK
jgi:RND family efflux transporter MFP subunit